MNGLLTTVPIAALTESRTLFELGLVVVLAAAAPLIGQILRLPSILVLLALGFGAGAVGALDPNALLGQQLISAVVSVAVGIILFEAGLGLKLSTLTGAVAQVPRRIEAGGEISVAEPAAANGGKDRLAGLGANGIAMFVHTPGKELDVVAAGDRTEPHEGQELIGLRG